MPLISDAYDIDIGPNYDGVIDPDEVLIDPIAAQLLIELPECHMSSVRRAIQLADDKLTTDWNAREERIFIAHCDRNVIELKMARDGDHVVLTGEYYSNGVTFRNDSVTFSRMSETLWAAIEEGERVERYAEFPPLAGRIIKGKVVIEEGIHREWKLNLNIEGVQTLAEVFPDWD